MSMPPPLTLPETLPVMVLSQCTLFPHSLLPLSIFEPRYQRMLATALSAERMFAIGYLDGPSQWSEADELDSRIRPMTTCGFVRACVENPDGTSRLMLQGLHRVRIIEWVQQVPYRIARVTPVALPQAEVPITEAQVTQLFTLIKPLMVAGNESSRSLLAHFSQVKELSMLLDLLAANFLTDGQQRQDFLELTDLETRWNFLIEQLEKSVVKL